MDFYARLKQQGEKIKTPLDEMPEVFPDVARYWDAFVLLSSGRQSGMASCPIPLSEILAYFQFRSILCKDEQRQFLYYLKALDREYLNFQAEQSKQQAKTKPTPTKKKRKQ